MKTKLQSKKNPTLDSGASAVEGELEQHRFALASADSDAMTLPSLGQQLQRATTFGHNISNLSVQSAPPEFGQQLQRATRLGHSVSNLNANVQAHAGVPIQRMGLEEEDEEKISGDSFSLDAPKGLQTLAKSSQMRMRQAGALAEQFQATSAQAKSVNGLLADTQRTYTSIASAQYKPAIFQAQGSPINGDPALESEADVMGARAANGQPVRIPGTPAQLQSARDTQPTQSSRQPVQFDFGIISIPLIVGKVAMVVAKIAIKILIKIKMLLMKLLIKIKMMVMKLLLKVKTLVMKLLTKLKLNLKSGLSDLLGNLKKELFNVKEFIFEVKSVMQELAGGASGDGGGSAAAASGGGADF